jgi:hypothetical protein
MEYVGYLSVPFSRALSINQTRIPGHLILDWIFRNFNSIDHV